NASFYFFWYRPELSITLILKNTLVKSETAGLTKA
ncbi:MAG: hypothetical protein ACI892_001162, partial [Marinobacter maritimus]